MTALVKNSADPKQIKAASQKETIRVEQIANDRKAVMSTPSGRRFVRRLIMEIAGKDRSTVYGDGLTGRGVDPILEGMRNVGLQVYAEVLDSCAEEWFLAEKEHRAQLQAEGLTK